MLTNNNAFEVPYENIPSPLYFLHLGIQVMFDLSRPAGQRLVAMSLLCTECRVPRYEPLDLEKTYKLVMPSYIADGGDGFTMIKLEKLKHDTGEKEVCLVITDKNGMQWIMYRSVASLFVT